MLVDTHGRVIDYLRISVTDRCNFRCVYCCPPGGAALVPREKLLAPDEFVRVARVGAGLGIRKIKLTGGEPTVYADIVALVERLGALADIEDLSLTTNGTRLRRLARPLWAAGLRRLNVSLDSLRPERFARMARGGDLAEVLEGFATAKALGFEVKVNAVVLRGWNEDEVFDLVEFARREDVEVRFIEFMPLCGQGWDRDLFVSAREIRERLAERFTLTEQSPNGVARVYRTGTGARVGFIPTLSQPFCDACRRLRLTAWGTLRPCLFSRREVDLRPLLRAGCSDAELRHAIVESVTMKPRRNPVLAREEDGAALRIRSIGG